jgi:hypothetical protein
MCVAFERKEDQLADWDEQEGRHWRCEVTSECDAELVKPRSGFVEFDDHCEE